MVKLFVGGFPLEITEMDLAKMFAIYGDISTIKIVRDKQTRKCKGYAFIEMTTLEAAENAIIGLDGVKMEDRVLTVNITEDKPAAPANNYRKPQHSNGTGGYHKGPRPDQNSQARNKRPRRPLS